jgi:hypothetical protein
MSRVRLVAAKPLIIENGLYPYMFATANTLPHMGDAWGYLSMISDRWQGLLINASKPVWASNGELNFSELPDCVMVTDQSHADVITSLLLHHGHQVETTIYNGELRTASR